MSNKDTIYDPVLYRRVFHNAVFNLGLVTHEDSKEDIFTVAEISFNRVFKFLRPLKPPQLLQRVCIIAMSL